jgi:hypothetical protein
MSFGQRWIAKGVVAAYISPPSMSTCFFLVFIDHQGAVNIECWPQSAVSDFGQNVWFTAEQLLPRRAVRSSRAGGTDQLGRRLEGWPNTAARLAGWRRVTRQV